MFKVGCNSRSEWQFPFRWIYPFLAVLIYLNSVSLYTSFDKQNWNLDSVWLHSLSSDLKQQKYIRHMTSNISHIFFFSTNLDCVALMIQVKQHGSFSQNLFMCVWGTMFLTDTKTIQFNLAVAAKRKMVKLQSFWDKLTLEFGNILFLSTCNMR